MPLFCFSHSSQTIETMRNELERTRRRRKRKRTERRVFISVTLENIDVHQWSSGKIVPCHGTDPGSIPGWCKLFLFANTPSCFTMLISPLFACIEHSRTKQGVSSLTGEKQHIDPRWTQVTSTKEQQRIEGLNVSYINRITRKKRGQTILLWNKSKAELILLFPLCNDWHSRIQIEGRLECWNSPTDQQECSEAYFKIKHLEQGHIQEIRVVFGKNLPIKWL